MLLWLFVTVDLLLYAVLCLGCFIYLCICKTLIDFIYLFGILCMCIITPCLYFVLFLFPIIYLSIVMIIMICHHCIRRF